MLHLFLLASLIVIPLASVVHAQTPNSQSDGILEPITVKTDLYPGNVDSKEEIDNALRIATKEKKRVLIVFGANWCYDCHVLDHALHEGDAGKVMKEHFVLVHVDIGEADKNLDLTRQYQVPLEKGVPAIAILEHDGKLLYSSGSGEFESARTMLKKELIQFLLRWKASGAEPKR